METLLTERNLEYVFNYFDADKSGKLSISELKKIIGIFGSNESVDKLVDEIMKEHDANQDAQISYMEFKDLMKKIL
jgi:Ca2+-binding EF-hand superfamily protein